MTAVSAVDDKLDIMAVTYVGDSLHIVTIAVIGRACNEKSLDFRGFFQSFLQFIKVKLLCYAKLSVKMWRDIFWKNIEKNAGVDYRFMCVAVDKQAVFANGEGENSRFYALSSSAGEKKTAFCAKILSSSRFGFIDKIVLITV